MKTAKILLTPDAIFGLSHFHRLLPLRARDIGGKWHKSEKVWQYQPDVHREVQELYFGVFGRENVSAKAVDYPVRVADVWVELSTKPLPIRCALPENHPDAPKRPFTAEPKLEPKPEVKPREYSQADFVRALLEAERDLYQRRIEDIDAKLLAMSKPVNVEDIETVEAPPAPLPAADVEEIETVEAKPVRLPKPRRKSVACPF